MTSTGLRWRWRAAWVTGVELALMEVTVRAVAALVVRAERMLVLVLVLARLLSGPRVPPTSPS